MKTEYSINIIWSEKDQEFLATVPEFDGLMAFGETYDEALKEIQDALEGYVEEYKESGYELPTPRKHLEYSGQFRLRLPKSLHQSLAEEAGREGVSLNQQILYILSDRHRVIEFEKLAQPSNTYNIYSKIEDTKYNFDKPRRSFVLSKLTGSSSITV